MDNEPSDNEVCNEFTNYKRWWPTQRYQRRIAAILGGLFGFFLSGIVVWYKIADSPPYEFADLRYPEIILWGFLDIIIWDFSFLWYEHRGLLWILGLAGALCGTIVWWRTAPDKRSSSRWPTPNRWIAAILGAIVIRILVAGLLTVIQVVGRFELPDISYYLNVGAMIGILWWTSSDGNAGNLSSDTPQEVPSNIVSDIENFPLSRCPRSIINWINEQETPFGSSLTIRTKGRKYQYTINGIASN